MILCTNNYLEDAIITIEDESSTYKSENLYSDTMNGADGYATFEQKILIDLGDEKQVTAVGIMNSSTDITLKGGAYFNTSIDLDYATGTDDNLTNPTNAYNTTLANFKPCDTNVAFGVLRFQIGNYQWESNVGNVGENIIFLKYGSTGTTYGALKFNGDALTITAIATSASNGLKRFYLPRLADGDILGGYFEYYFDSTAWTTAFLNTTSSIVISTSGAVYKDSIAEQNLVVTINGDLGLAGGLPYTPTIGTDYSTGTDSDLTLPNEEFDTFPNLSKVVITATDHGIQVGGSLRSSEVYTTQQTAGYMNQVYLIKDTSFGGRLVDAIKIPITKTSAPPTNNTFNFNANDYVYLNFTGIQDADKGFHKILSKEYNGIDYYFFIVKDANKPGEGTEFSQAYGGSDLTITVNTLDLQTDLESITVGDKIQLEGMEVVDDVAYTIQNVVTLNGLPYIQTWIDGIGGRAFTGSASLYYPIREVTCISYGKIISVYGDTELTPFLPVSSQYAQYDNNTRLSLGTLNYRFPLNTIGTQDMVSGLGYVFNDSNYSSPTEEDLNNPNDSTETASNFVPFVATDIGEPGYGNCYLKAGDAIWAFNGSYDSLSGGDISAPFRKSNQNQTMNGYIRFTVEWTSYPNPLIAEVSYFNDGFYPYAMATAASNGLKTFTFGGTQGSFQYYFHRAAWLYASTLGASIEYVIATNGSVYRNSISEENLIVDYAGNLGFSGSNGTISYGQVTLKPFNDVELNTWNSFHTGNKEFTITLPKDGVLTDGGSLTFQYNEDAFRHAFEGTSDTIVISQDGSVYKNSISSVNMVVDLAGNLGIAGGLQNTINYDYQLPLTTIVTEIDETYRYWKLQTVDTGLQYIGKFYLGIPIRSEYHKPGVIPSYISNDISNRSISGRFFSQPGILRKTEAFTVTIATQEEYIDWIDLYENRLTRLKPVIFCQFEETQARPFEPYFANITFVPKGRDLSKYSFTFNVEECT